MPSILREARKKTGWTQDKLAERLGFTKGYVSKLEKYGTNSIKTAKAIQAIFPDLTLQQISAAEPANDTP